MKYKKSTERRREMNPVRIGSTIAKLRKKFGLTQLQLAERLNVSDKAVSKWENGTSMPDISQIVPLAVVFGVMTDVLFGFAETTAEEEAQKIIGEAYAAEEYGKRGTYLTAYDILSEGLKKYPNHLPLLNHCMRLGLALSMPENGWIYASERAEEIAAETIRQANFIIAYSKNISDIMTARQVLVFLYSSAANFDKAMSEAQNFPVRTDFTLYSNMAIVSEHMGNYPQAAAYLCSDIDYALQALEDHTARLGKAYYSSGKYRDAIAVYETFFSVMKAIFGDDCPPPYHDFDSGDCYLLLAQAYLAIGDAEHALNSVEHSVEYYLNLRETCKDDKIERKTLMKSPLVKETELSGTISKSILKEKLLEKLSSDEIQFLSNNQRFRELQQAVNNLENS